MSRSVKLSKGARAVARRRRHPDSAGFSFTSRRSLFAIAAVVAFLIVDGLLIWLAFSATRANVPENVSAPEYSLGGPTSTATPTPDASAAAPLGETAVAAPRLLSVGSETTAWRAVPGACGAAPATVERTTDGGATWEEFSTGDDDIRQILQLTARDDSLVTVMGAAGSSCSIDAFRSFTGGQFWEPTEVDARGGAYIDPADRSVINTSSGPVPSPCAEAREVSVGAALAVLCDDGVRTRAGETWVHAPIAGAVAIAATDSGVTVAVTGSPSCAGIEIHTVAPGATTSTPIGCQADETSPVAVTLAQRDGSVWLWVGDSVSVSTDGGASW